MEDSFEKSIPGGIGEAAGNFVTISTGNTDWIKWGQIVDLVSAFVLGRVGPPSSLLDESIAIISNADGLIGITSELRGIFCQ